MKSSHIFVFLFILPLLFFATPNFVSATTLYYNAAEDTDWENLNNWWSDSGFSVQALALPDADDDVILSEYVDGGNPDPVNSMVVNGGFFAISIVVSSGATFNTGGFNTGDITGNVIFNNSTYNQGSVIGDATFNNSSANFGTVSGDATFNTTYYGSAPVGGVFTLSNSRNWSGSVGGTVYGSDAVEITSYVFNDSSALAGSSIITGDATFNTTYYGPVPSDGVFTITNQNWTGRVNGIVYGSDDEPITLYIFNGSRWNSINSVVNVDAVFNSTSHNRSGATVSGNACFASTATNSGTVSGTVSVCTTPTVSTSAAESVAKNTATLNGTLSVLGGSRALQHGFTYGNNSSLTDVVATTTLGTKSSTGTFTQDLTGLNCENTYYFRPYSTNGTATGFGSISSFTTTACVTESGGSSGGGGRDRTPSTHTTPTNSSSNTSTTKTTANEIFTLLTFLDIDITPAQNSAILQAFPNTTTAPVTPFIPPTYTPAPSTTTSCTALTQEMWLGHDDINTNGEVSKLQSFLISKGYLTLPPDTALGYYGSLTADAVSKFQIDSNVIAGGTLQTTGLGGVGPKTRTTIQSQSCSDN